MNRSLTALILLLAAGGSLAQWRLGAPVSALPEEFQGQLTVVLSGESGAKLKDGERQLHARGIRVFHRQSEDQLAYLVDASGVVRRREKLPETAVDLVAFVADWEAGRTIYRNRCARCHGDDGMDVGYPFIAQLGGIGERWTRSQIRAKLNPAGAEAHPILVRGEQFSKEEFAALVTFLAGL